MRYMPKIYRAMLVTDGIPQIGDQSCMLGLRTPPNEIEDIAPDAVGIVSPQNGGMSVNPSLSSVPAVFIPRRWRHVYPEFKDARGKDTIEVFTHGSGEFIQAHVTDDLMLRPDSVRHGVVEPSRRMHVNVNRSALASTQTDWQLLAKPDGS
jgi:hypothetical protein